MATFVPVYIFVTYLLHISVDSAILFCAFPSRSLLQSDFEKEENCNARRAKVRFAWVGSDDIAKVN